MFPAMLLACWSAAPGVFAHDFTITDTRTTLTADGRFQIDLTCDLDALALGEDSRKDSAELARRLRAMPAEELDACVENLKALFARRVRVRFDGQDVPFEVSFPSRGVGLTHADEIPTVLGVTARLAGPVPEGAEAFTFWASRSFAAVHLSVRREGCESVDQEVLAPGQESRPYALRGGRQAASTGQIAWQYLALGYEHILPRGLDHILFVLGLFLLGRRWKPLCWQVTAFTVAHSITLGLAMYGWISLSPKIVEPLIALSIAYVAVENLVTGELKPWRPAVVFGFGLLHGLGFAGVLTELGLPRGDFATALVTFNLGVELGQLSVIALAFLCVGWLRGRQTYRARVVIPSSTAIAAVALYWSVERIFG